MVNCDISWSVPDQLKFLTADQEHTAAHTLTLPLSLELLVTVLNIIRALQRTRNLYKSVQSFSDFVFGPKG